MTDNGNPKFFYTVREAADLMRVGASTLYRAIREDAFPAVKISTRYVVPTKAVEQLVERAAERDGCVDVAALAAEKRQQREMERLYPEWRK